MAKAEHTHQAATQRGFAVRRKGLERCACGAWRLKSVCSTWWRNDG